MSFIVSKISNLFPRTHKEHMSYDVSQTQRQQPSFSVIDVIILFISSYAVYLSWSCNTVKNVDLLLKLIYAFFAFLFGVPYVVFYAVFKEKLTPCK